MGDRQNDTRGEFHIIFGSKFKDSAYFTLLYIIKMLAMQVVFTGDGNALVSVVAEILPVPMMYGMY